MKSFIKRTLPKWFVDIIRYLNSKTFYKKRIIDQVTTVNENIKKTNAFLEKIYTNSIIRILHGPFKDMKYITSSNGSTLLPKLMGSYEEPIHKWIYEILKNDYYSIIVDVGCAEGYYAVGFTKAKSSPKVIAFDVDKDALKNAKKLADINGVSSLVEFHEKFEPLYIQKIFERDSNQNILIFMDVEGAELELLNTNVNPVLLNCNILVELHDCFYPGLTEKVIGYFQGTHKIEIIVDYPSRSDFYLANDGAFSEVDKKFMVDERRPIAMRWMYAKR